ncbi:short-chain dehydrogenase [Christiangramia fulva]|uniref:Short-chain dehydrogenase n=1 Tax=Christiangramia fulva TaxID=2126553 RepID=A0A2R3Z1T5_9FLAO|nr:SDR family NAD(P)-dependent oxidoreductase [Christiangramia fulva]AVR44209.1 short-chain dehydrogenase [Christiangramia fulva]
MHIKNKKVLITGGNSGIGKAIIKELIHHGVKEIAVFARNLNTLERLKSDFPSAQFLLLKGDLSSTEDLKKCITVIQSNWKELDILINNAGVVSAGLLSEVSQEDIIQQINVNLTGLILLTKKSLPLLKQSHQSAIVNISSGYGYIAMPFYSVYATTKAAVRQFSDAMRRELYQYPIHVMTVYPSATNTNMMKTAEVDEMDSPEKVAKLVVEGLISEEINVILGGEERKKQIELNFMDPKKIDELAAENYEALKKRTKNHRAM